MNNKEKYRLACERHPEVPLFAQYWWMDAICVGKTWDVLLVEEKGEMLGALPYLWVRKGFLKMILQPIFSQNNGVHFFYPEGLDEAGLLARGVNQSVVHVDFMVGTPDLSITGTTRDGREIPVFVNGNFAF